MSRGPWIQTLSGRHWYPFSPRAEDVHFGDLRALARVNRFGGHMREGIDWYTVAEHSVRVAWRAKGLAIAALFPRDVVRQITKAAGAHDAHEAYPPGDQLAPFLRGCRSGCRGDAMAFEGLFLVIRQAETAVRSALGIMAESDVDWGELPALLQERISPWNPLRAWAEFEAVFVETQP